VNFELGDWVV